MSFLIPFILTFLGVVLDYVTTEMGLSRGFVEINPNVSFINLFLSVTALLFFVYYAIPDFKYKLHYMVFISAFTFFPCIHNSLVLAGVFDGFTR